MALAPDIIPTSFRSTTSGSVHASVPGYGVPPPVEGPGEGAPSRDAAAAAGSDVIASDAPVKPSSAAALAPSNPLATPSTVADETSVVEAPSGAAETLTLQPANTPTIRAGTQDLR